MKTPRISLHKRTLACRNRLFDVFFDDIRSSSGERVPRYLVVAPRHGTKDMVTGVAALPLVDGKIGLIRIYRHAVRGFSWEIPRGFLDPGEGPAESALRELREETGLGCPRAALLDLGSLAPDPGTFAARIRLFAALRCRPVPGVARAEMGHGEFRLFTPKQVAALAGGSRIQDPSTLVAFYRYQSGKGR